MIELSGLYVYDVEAFFVALLNIIGGEEMANEKILAKKQEIIDEIKDRVQNSSSVVLFDYRGMTDAEKTMLTIKYIKIL